MLFVLRRLYRKEPERALQFAWDVRFFEMLRRAQKERKKNDPRWLHPRILPSWLQRDAPLAKTPTADGQLWWMWLQWSEMLRQTPRKEWRRLGDAFACASPDMEAYLVKELSAARTSKKTITSVALDLTAIQANPKEPNAESLRVRFSRAGLPTNATSYRRR